MKKIQNSLQIWQADAGASKRLFKTNRLVSQLEGVSRVLVVYLSFIWSIVSFLFMFK